MSYGHNNTTKKQKSWNVRESKNQPDLAPRSRVDLDPHAFDQLLLQKGMNCKVYRTMYCPKVKSVDGAEHEIDCDLCNSSGFIDFDPIQAKVFIQTQELDKLPNVEGFVDGNTVLMTFPIGVEVQYFTRIELTDFTNIYFQRILRNPDSNTDVLQYRACRANALIDYDGARYYEGQDFKLDFDGNIQWMNAVQTRTITFSAEPTSGFWNLMYGGHLVDQFGFTATAGDIQAVLSTFTGFPLLVVAGNYADGFVVSFLGANSLLPDLTTTLDKIAPLTDGDDDIQIEVDATVVGTGRRPANNVPYSVHYEAPQQFRAHAAGHVNRYTQAKSKATAQIEFIKMPEQWYCAKEFLPKRLNKQGEELQQGPYDNHSIVEED